MKSTIIDLFAGAGGLSEGFWANDFDVIAHAEMDKDACKTLLTRAVFHHLKSTNELSDYFLYQKGEKQISEIIEKHKLDFGAVLDN